jgi:hypothetical protein
MNAVPKQLMWTSLDVRCGGRYRLFDPLERVHDERLALHHQFVHRQGGEHQRHRLEAAVRM